MKKNIHIIFTCLLLVFVIFGFASQSARAQVYSCTSGQTACPAGCTFGVNCTSCWSAPTCTIAGQTYTACGSCQCPAGQVVCGSACQSPVDATCQPGQTYNACSGCSGPINVVLNPSATQAGFLSVTGTTDPTAPTGGLYYKTGTGEALRVKKSDGSWADVGKTYSAPAGSNLTIDNTANTVSVVKQPLFEKLALGTAAQPPNLGDAALSGNLMLGSGASFPAGAPATGSIIGTGNVYTNAIYSRLASTSADNIWIGDANDILQVQGSADIGSGDIAGSSTFVRGRASIGSSSVVLPTGADLAVLRVNFSDATTASNQYAFSLYNTSRATPTIFSVNRNGDLSLSGNLIASGNLTAGGTLTVQGSGSSSFAGNLGIGTTAPSDKLQVVGSASITGGNTLKFDTANIAPPSATNNLLGTRLLLYPGAAPAYYAIGVEGGNLWFQSNGGYKLYENLSGTITPVVTVDSSGNVDISGSISAGNPTSDFKVKTIPSITLSTTGAWQTLVSALLSGLQTDKVFYVGLMYHGSSWASGEWQPVASSNYKISGGTLQVINAAGTFIYRGIIVYEP